MKKQQGAGAISMLVMVVLAVMGLVIVMKVIPFYSDDMSVETVFKNLEKEGNPDGDLSRSRVAEMIEKRFSINGISELSPLVEVTGQGSAIVIEMEYERRVPLISNIELVATFNHYIDLSE